MTTDSPPMNFDRPLVELEVLLMSRLAAYSVAFQTGASADDTTDALAEVAERGEAEIQWDATDAFLLVGGHVIVHASRDWLAYTALIAPLED
jgi:hypothetical protein